MPYVEIPEDIAEEVANAIGVYGSHPPDFNDINNECTCRTCFIIDFVRRIRESVDNERKLQAM